MSTAATADKEDLKKALNNMFGPNGHADIVEEKESDADKAKREADEKAKKQEEEEARKKKEEEEKAKQTPPPEAKPKRVKKAAPAPKEPAAPDESELQQERERLAADAAARATAEIMKNRGKDPIEEIPTTAEIELTEEDKERLEVLTFMGSTNPQYADLADRTRTFWKKEDEYRIKWEKENPAREYDPEASEHAEFYETHEPQVDDRQLKKAEKLMVEDRIEKRLERKNEEKRRIEKEKELQQSEAGKIKDVADDSIVSMITQVDPDAAKHLEKDGKTVLSEESWAKLEEEDPGAAEILKEEGDYLGRVVTELERLNRYQDTYHPSTENPLHVHITQEDLQRKHEEILANQKLQDTEKRKALKALDGKYWTLQPEHVKALLIGKHQKRAQQKLSKMRKIEERYKKKYSSSATATPPRQEPAPAPAPTPTPAPATPTPAPRHKPPTTATSADRLPTATKGGGDGVDTVETIRKFGF
jgi:hypothetical protein